MSRKSDVYHIPQAEYDRIYNSGFNHGNHLGQIDGTLTTIRVIEGREQAGKWNCKKCDSLINAQDCPSCGLNQAPF